MSQYFPQYKLPNDNLSSPVWYTFAGAGFYKCGNQIILKWHNKDAWVAILYRHLYTVAQRDQLFAYIAVATNPKRSDAQRDALTDGRFTMNNVEYCVRNMYIYKYETMCRQIYADAYRICMAANIYSQYNRDICISTYLTELLYQHVYTITDILYLIDQIPTYLPNKYTNFQKYIVVLPTGTKMVINSTQSLAKFIAAYGCASHIHQHYHNVHIPQQIHQPLDYSGLMNFVGTCERQSGLHLLTDIKLFKKYCDHYTPIPPHNVSTIDMDSTHITYMVKTFCEFYNDIDRSGNRDDRHRMTEKYYILYQYLFMYCVDMGRDIQLPRKYLDIHTYWNTRHFINAHKPLTSHIYQDNSTHTHQHKLTIYRDGCFKCIFDRFGKLQNDTPIPFVLSSIKYIQYTSHISVTDNLKDADVVEISIIFYRPYVTNVATPPIRVRNTQTNTDYILISYVGVNTEGTHATYTNMTTRTKYDNACSIDYPQAMLQCVYNYGYNIPDNTYVTNQAIDAWIYLLYQNTGEPSQIIDHV